MAWLQKRPQVSDSVQYYSMGLNKTILIVGLGNPGKEYDLTRHNVGFMCVDNFVEATDEMDPWIVKKDLKCLVSQGQLGATRVYVTKPNTFMNLSGDSVQAIASFYKIAAENIVVVHDELDIDFGHIRLRIGGASAGHNGIKSITSQIGEGYGRIRIGVGPKTPQQIDSADFVLQQFKAKEQQELPKLYREINAILSELVYGGELPHETRSFII